MVESEEAGEEEEEALFDAEDDDDDEEEEGELGLELAPTVPSLCLVVTDGEVQSSQWCCLIALSRQDSLQYASSQPNAQGTTLALSLAVSSSMDGRGRRVGREGKVPSSSNCTS